jgi:predicted PurR-regulated permease PerM
VRVPRTSDEPAFRTGFARSQVSVKTVLTVGVTVLALIGVVWALSHMVLALTITVASALIAVALNHGVEALERHGIGRGLAVALILSGLLLALAGIALLLIPTAAAQIGQLAERLPDLYAQVRRSALFQSLDRRFDLDRQIEGLLHSGPSMAGEALTTSFAALGSLARGTIAVVTLFFGVTFMLLFGRRVVDGILAETVPATRERYERVLAKCYRSIGGYLAGLAFIAAFNATLTSIVLAIIGVPFFLPLGILSGLGSLVPYVGAITAGGLISVVALVSQGLWTGVGTLAYYVAYQQILENHILVPLVYKRTIQLNPLVTLLAVIFLGDAAGMIGAILAVPAVAVGQIVVRELLLLRRERLHVPPTGEVTEALGGAAPPRPSRREEVEDRGPRVPH